MLPGIVASAPNVGSGAGDAGVAGRVSRWALDEALGTVAADADGTQDGTIVGSPSFAGPALTTTTVSSIAGDGVDDHVSIPDNPAYNLAAFTICGHALADTGDDKRWLASKDASGANRWSVEKDGTALRGYIYRDDGTVTPIISSAGAVPIGQAFFWAFSCGAAGLKLYVGEAPGAASVVASDPAQTHGAAGNTSPLYLMAFRGAAVEPAWPGDFDATEFYNRQLSDAEVASLSDPILFSRANDDSASIEETGNVLIDVLANDGTVGAVTSVVATQGTIGSTAVEGTSIRYTSTGGTGSDSFTYHFFDDNGQSNTATVNVTVTVAGGGGQAVTDSGGQAVTDSGGAGVTTF